jgi:hypothetical protein
VALSLEFGHGGDEVGFEEAAQRGRRRRGGRGRGAVRGGEALQGLDGVDGLRGEGAAALERTAVVSRAAGDGAGAGADVGPEPRSWARGGARDEEEGRHGRSRSKRGRKADRWLAFDDGLQSV